MGIPLFSVRIIQFRNQQTSDSNPPIGSKENKAPPRLKGLVRWRLFFTAFLHLTTFT